ncbi:hypothetical protein Tco_1312363 [Tanacetum coccineum]
MAAGLDYETEFEQQRVGRPRGASVIAGGIVSLSPRCTEKSSRTEVEAVLGSNNKFEKHVSQILPFWIAKVLTLGYCMFLNTAYLAVDISFKICFDTKRSKNITNRGVLRSKGP